MKTSSRHLSRLQAAVAACCIAAVPTACGDSAEPPPNLVLVTVDSLRADFLECYGGKAEVGARMCALGREGTRYAWAFAPASSSPSSIASLLTSQYPSTHGVGVSAASFLRDEFITLAEVLGRGGYATAAFVSSPELNRSRNLQQGFDLYDDRMSRTLPAGLPWRQATRLSDAALAWLQEAESPWFVWIHYREPHGPYQSPALAAPSPVPAPTSVRGERLQLLATPTGRGGIPGYQAIPGLFTREGYEARYRREIRTVDSQIARLVTEIEAGGEPFGIAVTADHGEAFGEDRYYFSHGHSVGLDQIRVPLFWRPPAGGQSEPIRVPVSTLDLAPTLLRAAGISAPAPLEGWPLPSGDDPPGAPEQARAVFAEHPLQVAVVSGENFYSRLRVPAVPIPARAPERVTPAYLRAAVARTARLSSRSDELPATEPARPTGIAPFLEPLLVDFVAVEP
ncbi:MAG: sulfatase [Myxococcota bacterium]|nr:sulfatase [Myxococcota bacterium]